MVEVLQEAAPAAEVAFIEQLLEAPDQSAVEKLLAGNEELVNDDFEHAKRLMAQLNAQGQNGQEANKLKS